MLIILRRFGLVMLLVLMIQQKARAQKPEIVSIDKVKGRNQGIVTINGSGFGTDPMKLKVFFGASPAEIKTASNQLVEVYIPAGATFDNISVTNIVTGETAYSSSRFLPVFGGETGISSANFTAQSDFTADNGLYDLCLCDFNKDKKVDVATVGDKANTISLLINTSTAGNASLNRSTVLINAKTLHVACGDLNGDGNPEITATENDGDRVFILKNNGNGGFSTQTIKLTGNKVKRISIADLDLDGKPELVITDQLKNIVTILKNQSTTAILSFDQPLRITLPEVSSSDALDIQDLNMDGLPEIVTSPFFSSANNKIFILINKSSPGNLNFNDTKVISVSNTIVNIRIGDLDGDLKPDFAVTRILNAEIHIYRNTTTGNEISFSEPIAVATSTRPWGLDFGDLDGDGKPDIVVASIDTKSLSVLNNKSSSGTISFEPMVGINTTYINKHVRIGDIDGDGKPDINFTSIDDGNLAILASKVSVVRNKSCLVPVIAPEGPITICSGLDFNLTGSVSSGATYEWKNGGTSVAPPNSEADLNITTGGTYSVTVNSDGCERTSNTVTVNIAIPGSGLNSTPPDARSNGPVCTGTTMQLELNDVGASAYRWKGPAGFIEESTSLSVTRNNFTLEHAGLYVVEMLIETPSGLCVSKVDSTIVEGVDVPEFTLSYSGSEDICEGTTKNILITPPATSGFDFQWFEQSSGVIGTATSNSLEVSQSGVYHAEISSEAGCAPVTTEDVTVNVLTAPVPYFTIPSSICLGSVTEINNESTVDANATVEYHWEMETGSVIEGIDPVHTYSTSGNKTVTLTINYTGVSGCTSELTANTIVTPVDQPEIISTLSALCPSDTTSLSIEGDYQTILWSNNADTKKITIDSPGEYFVVVTDANNCESSDQITIGAKEAPQLTISVPKEVINLGEAIVLSADIADPLDNNALYAWTPKESLDDSTKQSPTARPTTTTTYVLKATTEDGCVATGSVTVQVLEGGVGVKPSPLFSPNNDGNNDTWTIAGVENYPDCSLNIFDSKGRRVFEAKGYSNDWTGEHNGNQLPEGVYYFVFGCPDEKPLTGTVVVVR